MSLRSWLTTIAMVGSLVGPPGLAFAQVTDYSAGKSPAQLFSTDCAACHQSARGLAKGRDQRSLASFLREHYTTKQETAATLAAFLAGAPAGPAAETRNPGSPGARQPPSSAAPHQQAARPPRPPSNVDPAAEDIVAPEPGQPDPRRARQTPAREAAKPPPANQRGRRTEPEPGRGDGDPEATRAKVRGYATVGEEAKPKAGAPAPAAVAPAASEPAKPAETAAPAEKPSEPAPAEERKSPPG